MEPCVIDDGLEEVYATLVGGVVEGVLVALDGICCLLEANFQDRCAPQCFVVVERQFSWICN